jgi:hypothetical protein
MFYIGQKTGNTQKNGAVSIVFTIETAPFFCVYSVYYSKVPTYDMTYDPASQATVIDGWKCTVQIRVKC